jgi:hypothetical protein
MKYIEVTADGLEICESKQLLTLEEMQMLVGNPAEKGFITLVQNRFSDHSVVIVCDEEGLLKPLPLVAKTRLDDRLFGNLIILRNVPYADGYKLEGLTEQQIIIVREELILAQKVGGQSHE